MNTFNLSFQSFIEKAEGQSSQSILSETQKHEIFLRVPGSAQYLKRLCSIKFIQSLSSQLAPEDTRILCMSSHSASNAALLLIHALRGSKARLQNFSRFVGGEPG